MAKTVIKHGKKVYKAVCTTCGCEFLYNDEDIEGEEYHDLDGNLLKKTLVFVECPDCGSKIDHGPRIRG